MFFILHIILMATATLGIMAGVSTAVFFRRKKNWLKIHRTFNALSFGLMTAGIITAFIYITGSGGKHMNGLHQITGLSVFIFTFITLYIGFYQFKAKNKPAARTAHRWLGRLSLFVLMTAVLLGLKFINIL